jgi:hypothetical protein
MHSNRLKSVAGTHSLCTSKDLDTIREVFEKCFGVEFSQTIFFPKNMHKFSADILI